MKKKTVKVKIEKGGDGSYSAYTEMKDLPYGLIGEGKTVKEVLEDFRSAYDDMRIAYEESNEVFPEADFIFYYDAASFLQYYSSAFSLAGLERITGINQKQLGHYISGYRKPSPKTVHKLETGIRNFCKELSALRFL